MSFTNKLKGLLSSNISSVEEEIPTGQGGNFSTIKKMMEVAIARSTHPKVREVCSALFIMRQIPSHNHLAEARAIGDFVKGNVRYVKDPLAMETIQDPIKMLEDISKGEASGDCDDMSLLVATLLLSVGIRPSLKVVRFRTLEGPYNHIYVTVKESNYKSKKVELVIDAIVKDQPIGYELKHQSFAIFNF